jgi:hypothetical protein
VRARPSNKSLTTAHHSVQCLFLFSRSCFPFLFPCPSTAARTSGTTATLCEGRTACSQCGPIRPPPSVPYHHHHHHRAPAAPHHVRPSHQRTAAVYERSDICYGCDCAQCRSSLGPPLAAAQDVCCQCCACASADIAAARARTGAGKTGNLGRPFKVRSMTLRGDNDETLEVCIANDEGVCGCLCPPRPRFVRLCGDDSTDLRLYTSTKFLF